jgi:hypothetical protein
MMHVNIHLPKWQYSFSDMVPGIWLAKIIAYFFLQKFRPNNQSMAKAKQNNKLKTKNIWQWEQKNLEDPIVLNN